MAAAPTDERDVKLKALVKTIFERVPKEKRLTVDVVMQLLKAKYVAVFPAEYLAERTEFLTGLIDSFYQPKSTDKTDSVDNANLKGKSPGDVESEEEDDDDDESSEEEDDEEDDEGDEEDDEEEEEGESYSEASEETDGEGDEGDGAPAEKRQKLEEGASEARRRSYEMAECLRRLSYRVRKQEEGESSETYLHEYLVPLFKEKGLDPARYSKDDIRRYRVKKELELLQSDGADMNLDRTTRSGRGLNHLAANKDATVSIKTSKFLDDE